jgi:hypothetical protein
MTTPTAEDLAAVPLLASLSPEELQAAAKLFTVRSYPKNAIVATEGDRLDLFNVILSGRDPVVLEAGRQLKLHPEGPGGHFADTTLQGQRSSVLLVRKAKDIAIGAEISNKGLLVSPDLGLLRLSDELDHSCRFAQRYPVYR